MSTTINTSFDVKSLPRWAQNDAAVVEKCKRNLAFRANVCTVKNLNAVGAKQYAEQLKREARR